jgi:hypothetical protein
VHAYLGICAKEVHFLMWKFDTFYKGALVEEDGHLVNVV